MGSFVKKYFLYFCENKIDEITLPGVMGLFCEKKCEKK
jgi:hypothetical protein